MVQILQEINNIPAGIDRQQVAFAGLYRISGRNYFYIFSIFSHTRTTCLRGSFMVIPLHISCRVLFLIFKDSASSCPGDTMQHKGQYQWPESPRILMIHDAFSDFMMRKSSWNIEIHGDPPPLRRSPYFCPMNTFIRSRCSVTSETLMAPRQETPARIRLVGLCP